MNEPSEMALLSGIQFLKIVSPFYFIISVKLVADGILRGAGLMKPFMIATFTDLTLRVILAIILFKSMGIYWNLVFLAYWLVYWCTIICMVLSKEILHLTQTITYPRIF